MHHVPSYHRDHDISSYRRDHDISSYNRDRDISSYHRDHDISSYHRDHDISSYHRDHDISSYNRDHDISSYRRDHDISSYNRDHDISSYHRDHDISSSLRPLPQVLERIRYGPVTIDAEYEEVKDGRCAGRVVDPDPELAEGNSEDPVIREDVNGTDRHNDETYYQIGECQTHDEHVAHLEHRNQTRLLVTCIHV